MRKHNKLRTTCESCGQPIAIPGRKYVISSFGGHTRRIHILSVMYFQADSKYVNAVCVDGKYLIDDRLKDLEEEFGTLFIRVRRDVLVSPHYLEEYKIEDNHTIAIVAGVDFPVGRGYRKAFRKHFYG